MKSLLTLCLAVAACAVFAIPAKQARIDVFNINKDKVPAVKIADKGNSVYTQIPGWMKRKDRSGALSVFDFKGTDWQTMKITFEAEGDGTAEINLMGPDVRDASKTKHLPANVDVQKLTVNGKVLYDGGDKFLTIWHNTPKVFRMPIKDGDKLVVEMVCRPSAE